jgi:hypothetical protein
LQAVCNIEVPSGAGRDDKGYPLEENPAQFYRGAQIRAAQIRSKIQVYLG